MATITPTVYVLHCMLNNQVLLAASCFAALKLDNSTLSCLHQGFYTRVQVLLLYLLQILTLPSNLFYGKQLTCSAKFSFERRLKDVSPLQFIGVSGIECRDKGSPSYYNTFEAVEVTKQVLAVFYLCYIATTIMR